MNFPNLASSDSANLGSPSLADLDQSASVARLTTEHDSTSESEAKEARLGFLFSSLSELVRKHNLILPKPRDHWRLVQEPVQGEINGLPSLRGYAVATNGIMVAIYLLSGKVQYGHLAFFNCDKEEKEKLMDKPSSKVSGKEKKIELIFEGF